MRVVNVHERTYPADITALAPFIDALGSPTDRLWPREDWPPMVLRDRLAIGSKGGHGPIRYSVDRYEEGRVAVFRFTRPRGWDGTHGFMAHTLPQGGTRLMHALEMRATGMGILLWVLVFRPLHDALLEEALDRVGAELGFPPPAPQARTARVRLLRWLLTPRRRRRRASTAARAKP